MAEQMKPSLTRRERQSGITHRRGKKLAQMTALVESKELRVRLTFQETDARVDLATAGLAAR
jgi:hypothetical protein